jgi:hypothetical protein
MRQPSALAYTHETSVAAAPQIPPLAPEAGDSTRTAVLATKLGMTVADLTEIVVISPLRS